MSQEWRFLACAKGNFQAKIRINSGETTACGASGDGILAPPRQLLFPGERVSDDGVEILESGAPGQRSINAVDIGDQRRRVAGAAVGDIDAEITPTDAADRGDDLEHRGAAAVTAVE